MRSNSYIGKPKPQKTVNGYLKQTLCKNWDIPALSDYQGEGFTYGEVAEKIARLHLLFQKAGINRGDHIAMVGRNSSKWCISFLATLTYGAVAVPILNDFTPDTIQHLVAHSESKLLFADSTTLNRLDTAQMNNLTGIIRIDDFAVVSAAVATLTEAHDRISKLFEAEYPDGFSPKNVKFAEVEPDAVVIINYTSGSTGFSKGVMLTEQNIWSNLQFCIDGLDFLLPGDNMLSMLPLAHMYGMMVELLHPFAKGCHIYLLNRTPSPGVLMSAFANIRPKLIVVVPLILEKIIRSKVFPTLETSKMKFLLRLPFIKNVIYKKVKASLIEAFGGNLLEMIIGGAGLSPDVETLLRRIKFPFTVGYGMTECGPLISYTPWNEQKFASCGQIVDRMEGRVDSPDPEQIPGVLWVRGDNVMKGYYKNPEATASEFRDGWMKTGDICTMDSDGYLTIRGRDKNLILGPSGQNIYPEEIEQKLNNLPYVAESIVIDAGGGTLEALIHPDYDAAGKSNLDDGQVKHIMEDNIRQLNTELPAYSKVKGMRIFRDEFEKTPKRSIKRYLYTNSSSDK